MAAFSKEIQVTGHRQPGMTAAPQGFCRTISTRLLKMLLGSVRRQMIVALARKLLIACGDW
jgi:hypothetical protein